VAGSSSPCAAQVRSVGFSVQPSVDGLADSPLTYAHNVRTLELWASSGIPVFDDSYAITIADDDSDPGERRFVTLGMGAAGRVVVVVYT
jgi:hypothetical protein